nr:hypothetical protein Iba_chr12dCG14380 [Ipomoea batatas]
MALNQAVDDTFKGSWNSLNVACRIVFYVAENWGTKLNHLSFVALQLLVIQNKSFTCSSKPTEGVLYYLKTSGPKRKQE